jgi:SAM-dependent methyltransferase
MSPGLQGAKHQCPACGSAGGTKRGRKNDHDIIDCRRCRTLYAFPIAHASIMHPYEDYYDPENLSVPDFISRRLDEIVAGFGAYRRVGRLLDIGFGAGSLLQAAARAGWIASGVEVSQTAAEHVKHLGFDIFRGELTEAQYPAGYFDVVTASEVLEHAPEPRPLMAEIARIVRSGGLFWATTPHAQGISAKTLGLKWSVFNPPEHLQLFSRGGIEALLTDAGFRCVHVATHGINPAELLSKLSGKANANDRADRLQSGYRLNEFMGQSRTRRALKKLINGALNSSRLGDCLKVWAVK